MAKLSRFALLAALAILIAGCKARELNALYGTYKADDQAATETLILKPDNTFLQTVKIKATGKTASSSGHYKFDQPTGFVIFKSGYIEVLDLFRRLRPDWSKPLTGVVDMPAVSCLGRYYIGTGAFVLYVKTPPPNKAQLWFCRKIL
ncbi:MAG: hypothetical protein ACREP6_08975 [Candidatus Binataceae bacterium]